MKKILVFLAFLLIATSVFAEEEKNILKEIIHNVTRPAEDILGKVEELEDIVVSPDKMKESSLMTASSVSVMDDTDIFSSQKRFVKDLITEYASVSVTQSGAFGAPAMIRVRGANPNQTLLIIDGMKVSDPASVDGAFNFAQLPFDNIKQIEITRGPQGALYGSDAIGGLINIESKKPDKPFFETGIEAGSLRTLDEYVNFGGYEKGLHYSFAYSQFNTRGISTTDSVTNPSIHEVDPYVRKSFAGRLDYDINNDLTIGATLRNIYARFRYDDSDPMTWALRDNDQLIGKSNLFLYSLYVEHRPIEQYDYSVRYSYMNNHRKDFDYPNGLNDWYEGRAARLDFQNNFHIFDYDVFTIGYDYLQELSDSYYTDFASGISDQPKVFDRNSGLYLQNKIHFKDILGSTQSMRVDNHSCFGTHNTYKIDAFYLAPTGTRVRGVYSTGFKAPSLYQLYAPANPAWGFLGGNVNLKPEDAKSYEIGIDQYLFGKTLKLSVTYFQIRFSNLIKYFTDPITFQSTYQNVSKAKSAGMEYGAEVNLFNEKLRVSANLTSNDTMDYSTDRELAKVPQNQFNINIAIKPIPKFALGIDVNHTGRYFDSGTDKIKQFTLVGLRADYSVSQNFSIFGRIENLFNKHYQEVRGYGEPGINAYGGVNSKF
ncbi:MAG: TonB-dependent receptor [Candidatus Omnitrophica bacterium]|nr:TonB-dependent receptor [Candidatus Omnitrophota bacterium]